MIAPFLYLTLGLIYILIEFLKFQIQTFMYKDKPKTILYFLFFALCAFSVGTNTLCIDRINNYNEKVYNQTIHELKTENRIKNDNLYINLHTEVKQAKTQKAIDNLNKDFHLQIENNNNVLTQKIAKEKPYYIFAKNIILLFIAFEMIAILAYHSIVHSTSQYKIKKYLSIIKFSNLYKIQL
jgi:hypothetical protein